MENTARGFRQLGVWQKAYEMTLEVYRLTKEFPKVEIYGLTSQLQRAAVSVPANIAEGYERNHRKEYLQFLYISKRSLGERETLLMLAKDLEYITDDSYRIADTKRSETAKMLLGLIRSLT